MSKIKITLDPGHVKNYNTGVIPSYKEGDAMFYLAYYMKEELEKMGIFDVYVTRKNISDNPSLDTRGRMAINNGSKIFISLHSNACSDRTVTGPLLFYSIKRPDSKIMGTELVDVIAKCMNKYTGVSRSRGAEYKKNSTRTADYYGVIRTAATSTPIQYIYLIEHGFHTNVKECEFLNNHDRLKELAKVEAEFLYTKFSPDDIEEYRTGTVNTNCLNVRSGPSVAYSKLGTLKKGDEVNIILKIGNWFKIRYGSKIAYVHANYIIENTINEIKEYKVVTELKGYMTADNAIKDRDPVMTVKPNIFYIYKAHANGSINITLDKTITTPGMWINPAKNVITKSRPAPPVIDVSKLTRIPMGYNNPPEVTPEQVIKYIKSVTTDYKLNCSLEDLIYHYIRAGYIENIRWDIAIAQSIKETNFFRFTGRVNYNKNNYAGLGAGNSSTPDGISFTTPFEGVMAQIQHLKAYATNNSVEYCTCYDTRFVYVKRGWSPYLEWLGLEENPNNYDIDPDEQAGWAVPGTNYGSSIRKIIDEMKKV